MNNIYCLMRNGRQLDNAQRTLLFILAQRLYRSGKRRIPIDTDSMKGMVRTERKYAQLGGTAGMEFEAKIEFEEGQTTITYLVRGADLSEDILAHGIWGIPDDETYRNLTDPTVN